MEEEKQRKKVARIQQDGGKESIRDERWVVYKGRSAGDPVGPPLTYSPHLIHSSLYMQHQRTAQNPAQHPVFLSPYVHKHRGVGGGGGRKEKPPLVQSASLATSPCPTLEPCRGTSGGQVLGEPWNVSGAVVTGDYGGWSYWGWRGAAPVGHTPQTAVEQNRGNIQSLSNPLWTGRTLTWTGLSFVLPPEVLEHDGTCS